MTDDAQLLREFSDKNSQAAFAELARRHVGWIYQAGLRRTGDRHDLAQEVVQEVFLALAKHARALVRHPTLAGWLFTTTRYAASHVLRAEARRRKYEAEAQHMSELEQESAGGDWTELRPLLDEALDRLSERDRVALLQRFFEGLSVAEIAARQGIGEDGARKRVDRALDKLRAGLGRRDVSSTAAALGALFGSQARAAAPPAVRALAVGAPWGAASAKPALALGVIHLMNMTKAGWAGVALMVVASLCSLTFAVREIRADAASRETLAEMTRRISASGAPAGGEDASGGSVSAGTVSRGTAVPAPAATRDQRRKDGREFLRWHPEVRGLLTGQFRAQMARNHVLFYRKAGLTPAQVDALETRLVAQWLDTLEATPAGYNAGKPEPSSSELVAILGEDGLRRWREFKREGVSDYFARNLALAISRGAEPPTVDQMVKIMNGVSQNSPVFRAGGSVDPATVDWAAALEEVSKILSPEQWREAQPWLQKTHVGARINALALAGEGS